MAREQRSKSLLRRACIGTLVLVGCLVVAELFVRTFLISPTHFQRDTVLGLRGRPGAAVIESREGYSRTHLNSLGLPDDEPRPNAMRHVLVVGDSYSEALHLPRSKNYTSVAETILSDTDIMNAGFGGFAPVQATVKAERLADRIAFDVVVLQVSGRDVEDLFDRSRLHLRSADNQHFEQVAPASYSRMSRPGRWKQWLMRQSALMNYVVSRSEILLGLERSRLRAKWSAPAIETHPKVTADASEAATRACLSLIERLRALDATVVLLYIPYVQYEFEPPRLREGSHHEFWKEVAERSGTALVDPTEALCKADLLSGHPAFGFANKRLGSGHLNRVGHSIVGKQLARALRIVYEAR